MGAWACNSANRAVVEEASDLPSLRKIDFMKELYLKTRREFLRTTMLGGALTWTIPSFLSQTFSALQAEAERKSTQPATGKDSSILVVIQMAGGNDGLNTIVPISNDYYYKARPSLGIKKDAALKLTDDIGFHPALSALKDIYDAGHLSIIHGVGYPNPNRSHFRSTEIWQTASDSNKVEHYGWLGRYFDNACKGADPGVGIAIGGQTPQAFSSSKPIGISLQNPRSYRYASDLEKSENGKGMFTRLNEPEMHEDSDANTGESIGMLPGAVKTKMSPLDYLERTALDAEVSSERIRGITEKTKNQATYPPSRLANSLSLVGRLIAGGMPTRVYYVSQGGFDTHTNQSGTHERLLAEFASAVKAFSDDLKAQGNGDRVLLMTFSEFGRRLAQNANGGTDHGAAAPMFVIGPKVKPGFVGRFPSLAPSDLFNGDPRFTTDFRAVYAGVLEDWLKTDSAPVLGRRFAPVSCLAG
jgi:uncharacterized protein (DUF1501 family)